METLVKTDATGHLFEIENIKDIVEGSSFDNSAVSIHISPSGLVRYGPLTSRMPQLMSRNNLSFEGALYLAER